MPPPWVDLSVAGAACLTGYCSARYIGNSMVKASSIRAGEIAIKDAMTKGKDSVSIVKDPVNDSESTVTSTVEEIDGWSIKIKPKPKRKKHEIRRTKKETTMTATEEEENKDEGGQEGGGSVT